jgi:hypothetical protein
MVFSKDTFGAIYMEYIKGFVPIRYRGYCLCISPYLILIYLQARVFQQSRPSSTLSKPRRAFISRTCYNPPVQPSRYITRQGVFCAYDSNNGWKNKIKLHLWYTFMKYNWRIIREAVVLFVKRCSGVVCIEAWKVVESFCPEPRRLLNTSRCYLQVTKYFKYLT